MQNGVYQSPGSISDGRMNDHSGRLVDRDQILVSEQNLEIDRLRFGSRLGFDRGRRKLNGLAPLESARRVGFASIQPQSPLSSSELDLRSCGRVLSVGKPCIQTHTRGLLGHRIHGHVLSLPLTHCARRSPGANGCKNRSCTLDVLADLSSQGVGGVELLLSTKPFDEL